MLKGEPAAEQCIVVDGVNFLNNADLEATALPPRGAPNIIMAAGGTQLKATLQDDAVFAWNFAVNWKNPAQRRGSQVLHRLPSRRIAACAAVS